MLVWEACPVPFFEILWLLLIVSTLLPVFQHRRVEQRRLRLLHRFQEERKSRVITLIHRQESYSLLGMLTRRFINIEDSEAVLRAIRLTPPDTPIDLILHTPGGLVLASEQIARALAKHPAKVTVFVPHYAMSGGTMIALAADEICMDDNAVLGPVDPQLGGFPAASILRAVEQKDKNEVDDETLILADIAAKAIEQVRDVVIDILRGKVSEERARELAGTLTSGQWTHDFPLTCEMLQSFGLPVTCRMPRAVYELMELYPQPAQRRPSVQYVPVPYRGPRPEPARGDDPS